MEGMLGAVIPALERAMRFRVARQGVLAANLANVDTPGYRRVDLRFDAELERAQSGLRRTHARHLEGVQGAQGDLQLRTESRSARPDGNGVVLEREVIQATRNAGAFTDMAAVLSRLLAMRRVAVIGDAR